MLNKSTVPVLFKGLNTKTDNRASMPGELVLCQNAAFDNPPRINKRNGFGKIGQATAGSFLAPYKSQLVVGTGAEAYSYTSTGLVDKGACEAFTISTLPIARDTYPKQTVDIAVHPLGISVYTFESIESGSTVSRYSVFDTVTAQPIVLNVQIGTAATKPKPLAIGNYVVIIYYETSSNHLRYLSIPVATPSTPTASADFATDPHTNQVFDAEVIGGIQGSIFVAYLNSAGANKLSIKPLTAALVLGAEYIPTTTQVPTTCISVFGDTLNNVWVAFYNGTDTKAAVFDFYLTTVLLTFTTLEATPGAVRNITGIAPTTTTATLFWEVGASPSYNNFIRTGTLTLAGVASSAATLSRSVGLASKPFYAAGRVHVLAAYQSTLQSTYFLFGGTKIVGKLAYGLGGGVTTKSALPESVSITANIFWTAYRRTDEVGIQEGLVFSQAGVQAATFDFTQSQTSVELSDDLHISGGILCMYDGAQVCEHGFNLYPENISASVSGVGLTGQYQYIVTWEWMDAQGLIHQSAPSPPLTLNPANQGYQLTIPTLRLTSKTTPISVVVWRTQADQTIFYRLTSLTAPLLNVTTSDTVTYTDNASDASIAGNAQIYSNPDNAAAELPNLSASSPRWLWKYRNRLFYVPADDPYRVDFSKSAVPGVPIEFNPQQLYFAVEQEDGPIVAGIQMDEKNILFKRDRIYWFAGDGPAPNGTGSDYGTTPYIVPSECGCTNPRSLVLTPQGVMFQSAKGFYLLTRGLTTEYIGAPVEAFNSAAVTAAKLAPNSRRVVFTLSNGNALAYDYFSGYWSQWTWVNAADLAVFGGLLTYVQQGGILAQETPGTFLDLGEPILLGLTTSWLSFAGISAFQRVYRVMVRGDYRSPHQLYISVAANDNPAAPQVSQINPGTILGTGSVFDTTVFDTDAAQFPFYEWRVHVANQKTTAVQITLQEAQTESYGEGCAFFGLAFEVGAKKGVHKIAAVQSS